MGFLFPLLLLILIGYVGKNILRASVFKSYFVSLLIFIISVYLFGMFLPLNVALTSLIILLSILAVYFMFNEIYKRTFFGSLSQLLPIILIYCAVYLFDLNRVFYQWDEFSHWGPMVKEMFRLNTFYTVTESQLAIHKDYPPMLSLLQYIWSYFAGAYREGYLYRSLHFLALVSFISILEEKEKNKAIDYILYTLVILSFFLFQSVIPLGDANFYNTIYIDHIVAILSAIGMFYVFDFKYRKFDWLRIGVLTIFLILSKQVNFFFVSLIMFTFLIRLLIDYNSTRKSNLFSITNFYKYSILLMGIVLSWFSWEIYTSKFEIYKQFEIKQIGLLKIFLNRSVLEPYQLNTIRTYFDALLNKVIIRSPIELSYISAIILLVILIVFFIRTIKKKSLKMYAYVTSAILLMGSVLYALLMGLLYVFSFGQYEGPILASFERYLNTYTLMFLNFILFLIVSNALSISIRKRYILISLFIIVTLYNNKDNLEDYYPAISSTSEFIDFSSELAIIQEMTQGQGNVYVIAQNSSKYFINVARYRLMPQLVNNDGYSLGKPYNDEDRWTMDISVDEFSDILREYDFVFLFRVDDQFRYTYNSLFEPDTYPNINQVFRIDTNQSQEIVLKRIY